MKANNIALQGSVNTEKSLDPATLSLDPGESLVNHAANSEMAGHCTCFAGRRGIFEDQEPANGEVSGRTFKRESQPCL